MRRNSHAAAVCAKMKAVSKLTAIYFTCSFYYNAVNFRSAPPPTFGIHINMYLFICSLFNDAFSVTKIIGL
jgi:hypothetical protein